VILIEDLRKVYHTRQGPHLVLDGVDLRVERGQKVGILGRNGAGKSTLIRLIGGAEYPTSGCVNRQMSVSWPLAFGGTFHPHLTGFDNLRFICRVYGLEYTDALPFIEEFTELGRYLREPVVHYSEGMRARLAFALSLAIEFDCFLIDEILSVGDSRFQARCQSELFEKRKDRAMIIASHHPPAITFHCERAAVLLDGKLHPFASVDEAQEFYETKTLGSRH
jgi:capsular polysaccharide transport system ATP-binding protein